MGGDAESAKPPHIVGHVTSLPREAVRRLREPRCGIVPVGRADFDAIDHQHAGSIHRSERRPRTISVAGEDEEGQRRAGGGARALPPLDPVPWDRLVCTWPAPATTGLDGTQDGVAPGAGLDGSEI